MSRSLQRQRPPFTDTAVFVSEKAARVLDVGRIVSTSLRRWTIRRGMSVRDLQALILLLSGSIVFLLMVRVQRSARNKPLESLLVSGAARTGSAVCTLGTIFVWQIAQAMELVFPDDAVAWHRVGFIGVALLPPAMLRIAQRVSGSDGTTLPLLLLVPVVTLAINFSGSTADFFWTGEVRDGPLGPELFYQRGPWFWVHTAHSYVCIAAAGLIAGLHYKAHPLRRAEGSIILTGVALPVVANVFELVFITTDFPLTPMVLFVTALLLSHAAMQTGIRELIPRVREEVLESMGDPVFVIEGDHTVLFANRAGQKVVGVLPGVTVPTDAFPQLRAFVLTGSVEGDVSFETASGAVHYHTVRSPLDLKEDISVVVLRDVTQDRTSQERIQQLAYFDSLTGLPNRRLFRRRLDRAVDHAREEGERLAVLVVDFDRFKQVNDTLGHGAGDRLLQVASERFLDSLRPQDMVTFTGQSSVSRVGGDEFVVLLTGLDGLGSAARVARRLCEAFDRPMTLGTDEEVVTSVSIGVATFPEDADTPAELIQAADRAMYESKEMPGSAVSLAAEMSPSTPDRSQSGLTLEAALRRALDRGEFEVYHQPIYSADRQRLESAEALLRWRHADGRLIGPAEFIQCAEDSGQVIQIGDWVLRSALEQVAKWRAHLPDLYVSVNISPTQLRQESYLENLIAAIDEAGDPRMLQIEMTERVLTYDLERGERDLQRIAELGVRLALDDFGTGYSSLSYLHRLPFDTVKIDRSFVAGLPDCERSYRICRGIIDMAHGLDLRVVAEGIESEAQRACIEGLGCDSAQGFLLGRPAPPAEWNVRLEREAARREILDLTAPAAEASEATDG